VLTQVIMGTETASEQKHFTTGRKRSMNPARAVHGLRNHEEETR